MSPTASEETSKALDPSSPIRGEVETKFPVRRIFPIINEMNFMIRCCGKRIEEFEESAGGWPSGRMKEIYTQELVSPTWARIFEMAWKVASITKFASFYQECYIICLKTMDIYFSRQG